MYSDCETLPCCDFQNIIQRQKHIRHAQIQNYTYFSRDLVSFIRVPVIVCRIAMPCCHRSASKNRQERIPQVALRAEMRTSQSQLTPLLATLQQKNQPNFSVSSFSCILSSQSVHSVFLFKAYLSQSLLYVSLQPSSVSSSLLFPCIQQPIGSRLHLLVA